MRYSRWRRSSRSSAVHPPRLPGRNCGPSWPHSAAGPDAITRVLEHPLHLASYDAGTYDLEARVRAAIGFTTPSEALALSNAERFEVSTWSVPQEKAWPSLADVGVEKYDFAAHDPETVWLAVDALDLARDVGDTSQLDPGTHGTVYAWKDPEVLASTRILTALGPQNPPASIAPWTSMEVSFGRAGAHATADHEEDFDEEDGWVNLHRLLTPNLVDAVPPRERADFLTSQVATAILSASVEWPSAQEPLVRLAQPAGS